MNEDPNVLILLYDQVPPILRWILAIFTLGILTMAWERWKKNEQKMRDLEEKTKYYMTRDEVTEEVRGIRHEMGSGFSRVHQRLDNLFEELLKSNSSANKPDERHQD